MLVGALVTWCPMTMAPKIGAAVADNSRMAVNFRTKRRSTSKCEHESVMRIEVAGMSREVCEACGRVKLGYIESHHGTSLVQAGADVSSDRDGSSASAG